MTMAPINAGILKNFLEGIGSSLIPYVGRHFDQRDRALMIQERDAATRERDAATRAQHANTVQTAVEVVNYLARTLVAASISGAIGITSIKTCDITRWSLRETSAGCSATNALGVLMLAVSAGTLSLALVQSYVAIQVLINK